MKRKDVVAVLQQLLPCVQNGELRYERLAEQSSDTFWKALFILYWQKYAQCVAELEHKISAHGGTLEPTPAAVLNASHDSFREHLAEDFGSLQTYERALTHPLPMDVQMLLQRHTLIFKDIIKRLELTSRQTAAATPIVTVIAAA